MVDGLISVRKREEDAKDEAKMNRKKQMSCVSENLPLVNKNKEQNVPEVLPRHDVCLRQFQYSKALDCVMVNYVINKHPHVTVALMQELIRRQGLKRALSGRDSKSLVNIIKFLNKYIGNIHFGRVLVEVANNLLGRFIYMRLLSEKEVMYHTFSIDKIKSSSTDVYEDHLDELGEEPRKMFTIMAQKLQVEMQLMMSLAQLQGMIETILSAAELATSPTETASSNTVKNDQSMEPSDAAQTERDLVLSIT